MTLYDLLNEGSSMLQQAGDTDAENDAKLLLLNAFDLNLVHFLMDRLRPLSETDVAVQEQIQNYRAMVAKRASRCSRSWAVRNSWDWTSLSMSMC